MYIVKVGGGDAINLEGIVADLAELDHSCLIVHGANALRDQIAQQLGRQKTILTSVSGYSSVYSDERAIDLIMMTYAGLRNKRLVELCHQHGINGVGLCGIDGKVIQGKRNKGIRVNEGGKTLIKRDFSGKPQSVNSELLSMLIQNGYTPVLSIPIIDEHNVAINSENDDIVNVLQDALKAPTIFQFIEAPGFLENKDDPNSIVKRMSPSALEQHEERVEGRMKRKMLALGRLFQAGAAEVIISDGRTAHPVKDALAGKGTLIK
ncbi:MAG: [LysW]-aminoadipate kinase [Gammaproteobacteria bacterium]|nr:[LysW]-aminoadipate kinase [Gammaproteobacteria bacterium]